MARLDILLTGYDITDEVVNRTSSSLLKLDHDTIRASASVEIWTGAGGTGTQLALTTDYTLGGEDARLTTDAGVTVYRTLAIVNGAYHSTDLYVTYKTCGDYGSVATIERIIQDQYAFDADLIGFTGYSVLDKYLPEKIQIARSHAIDDLITNEGGNAPVTFAASRSTTNPSYPRYNPCIPRHDGDHDISTTQTSQAVITELRNKKLSIGGYTDLACSVTGSVITVSGPSTGIRDALMQCLQNYGLATRFKSSGEAANYAASGPDWTYASRILAANINGVDYPIASTSTGSNTITVTGTPASGAQTLIIYPRRISGSTTSARLPSLSGFVPIPAGDGSLTVMAMAELMDTMQGHKHLIPPKGANAGAGSAAVIYYSGSFNNDSGVPKDDGTNGYPRTSKNTSPRTAGMCMYTWLGVLNAVDWTTE